MKVVRSVGGFMEGDTMGGSMLGGAVIWSLVVLLLVAATATAIVLLVRRTGQTGQPHHSSTAREAREILRSRYANGDIDDDEYRRRLASLDESA